MTAAIPSMFKLHASRAWSLKTKFALCGGALMGVFSIAFTTWTLHNVESDIHSNVVDAQLALVRSTAADIDAKVDLRQDAMSTVAALLQKSAPAPGAAMDAFFAPRPVLKKMFDDVIVVDADGKVIYEFPSGAVHSTFDNNVGKFDFFKRVKSGLPMVISSPFKSVASEVPYIAFSAPLRSSDGTVVGALIGLLNLSHGNFIGDLGTARIGKEGHLILVERGEHPMYVLHRQPELIASPAPVGSQLPIIIAARQGREGIFEGTGPYGVQTLQTFKPLRSVPWMLVALYPESEAFAGLQARRREVVAVGAAFFLLASAATWLLTGWLLRPLGRLQSMIGQHASNPGLRIAPENFGSAELAELVVAYNAQAAARLEFEERLHASEKRVREIVDNMPASIAYVDKNERYRFANARVFAQLGGQEAQIIGSTMSQLRGDVGYHVVAPYVAQALRGETVNFEMNESVEGRRRHTQFHFIPDRDEWGQIRGFYKMNFDITALKDAQERQALVEQRLRAITDHLPALIAHVDKEERCDFLNDAFRIWLGIDPAASIGKSMAEVLGSDIHARQREQVTRCLAGEALSFEIDVQTLIGRKVLRSEYLPDVDSDDSIAGFYTFSFDVTELKDVQRRLSKLVRSDSLTGLHNRLQLEETLPRAIARSRRSGLAIAVMFLDVDHFKRINDGFGHDVGDQILKEFAMRLSRCVRSTDTVARLGGDEFVVILEGLSAESEAEHVGKSIVDEIRKPFDITGDVLSVTTSIGIAFEADVDASETTQTLMKRADAALYVAKTAGRNGYHLSDV